MKDYDPMFDEFPEDDPLISTPCDCAEYRRLTEACADLLRERGRLKELIAEKDAQLGKRLCQYTRCIQFAELQAERDEWKRRAEMMWKAMYRVMYNKRMSVQTAFLHDHPESAEWFNNA